MVERNIIYSPFFFFVSINLSVQLIVIQRMENYPQWGIFIRFLDLKRQAKWKTGKIDSWKESEKKKYCETLTFGRRLRTLDGLAHSKISVELKWSKRFVWWHR